jgi:hypothetical protein
MVIKADRTPVAPTLGERLFLVGRKIAASKPDKTYPILTAHEDDIMEGWAERGVGLVAQLVGVETARLRNWQAKRPTVKPPERNHPHQFRQQGSSYVPFQSQGVEALQGQVGGCTRCGGYLLTGRDRDGDVVYCLNCSGGEGGRLAPQVVDITLPDE